MTKKWLFRASLKKAIYQFVIFDRKLKKEL